MPFFHDRSLLADLMKCGVQMVSEVLSWFKKVSLEAGYVVVLETAGRAGTWNPHLHILMTSGGVTPVEAGGYRLESGGAADGTLFGPLGLVVTYALDCRLV